MINNSFYKGTVYTCIASLFRRLPQPLFFNEIRFIPLGFAGVVFYLAPTFLFINAVFILNENLNFPKLFSFIIVWIAVVIFIIDILKEEKKISANNIQSLN